MFPQIGIKNVLQIKRYLILYKENGPYLCLELLSEIK